MKEEKREHPRAESDWTARIQREQLFFDGVVKNVSHRGAYICCDRKLIPREKVRIAIEDPDRAPLVIDAEVVWSRILSQNETCGLYGIGFRFIDVSDEDQRVIDLAVSAYFKTKGTKLKIKEQNE